MGLQSLAVLLLVVAGCTALAAKGQSVVARSDDESSIEEADGDTGGGQSRTIYSHKHLSPHRMMHFGKRLLVQQAPGIYTTTNQVLDLHRQPAEQQQQAAPFPYTLYFPVQRNRVLESVQPDSFGLTHDRQMMSVVQSLLGMPLRQQQQALQPDDCADGDARQQQQVQFKRPGRPKLMRLTKADGQQPDSANNESSPQTAYDKKQEAPDQPQQQAEAGQQEQQDSSATSNGRQEGDEIDRASRSVGPSRPLMSGLTRAQFSMLFGGQPSPNSQATSLLNFIKKNEPQRMTFMHFGRRR